MDETFRCTGRSHKGSTALPRSAFGDSAYFLDGRNRVCKACRCAANKRARGRKPSDNRTARVCRADGCMEPPQHRGTEYCAEHRQRPSEGRKLKKFAGFEVETHHDWAVSMLAGAGRKREVLEW